MLMRSGSPLWRGFFVVVAVVCLLNATVVATQAEPSPAGQAEAADSTAVLTEEKGDVLKRDFADEDRSTLSGPKPAFLGDKLGEGMQVATMQKSYAQLNWKDVVARLWAESMVAIAPNQRLVHLQDGELLFCLDKHRQDKREYVLWSNLLQARVRGTTVLFQTSKRKSQIAVLEGYIEVLDKRDRSVVKLSPGVVYEVLDKTPPDKDNSALSTASAIPNAATAAINWIGVGPAIPLFETKDTKNSVYVISPSAYASPLVTSLSTPLPSDASITHTLSGLTGKISGIANDVLQLPAAALRLLSGALEILRLPTGLDYAIGPLVGSNFKLPPNALAFFPPIGVIGTSTGGTAGGAQGGSPVPLVGALMHPGMNVVPIAGAVPGMSASVSPMAGGGLVAGTAGLAGGGGALTGGGLVPGAAGSFAGGTFAGGSAGLAATTGGVLNTTTATVSSLTSSTLGGVRSTLNTTGGIVNNILRLP